MGENGRSDGFSINGWIRKEVLEVITKWSGVYGRRFKVDEDELFDRSLILVLVKLNDGRLKPTSASMARGFACGVVKRSALALRTEGIRKAIYLAEIARARDSPNVNGNGGGRCEDLREAMRGLNNSERELITDRYVRGMPYKEIAEKHKCSLGGAHKQVTRILSKLRTLML